MTSNMAPIEPTTVEMEDLSCTHDMFSEFPKVKQMVLDIPSVVEASGEFYTLITFS